MIICGELWRTSWGNRHIQTYEDGCWMDEYRKEKKRCKATEGHSGVTIEEVGGSVEGVSPTDQG